MPAPQNYKAQLVQRLSYSDSAWLHSRITWRISQNLDRLEPPPVADGAVMNCSVFENHSDHDAAVEPRRKANRTPGTSSSKLERALERGKLEAFEQGLGELSEVFARARS